MQTLLAIVWGCVTILMIELMRTTWFMADVPSLPDNGALIVLYVFLFSIAFASAYRPRIFFSLGLITSGILTIVAVVGVAYVAGQYSNEMRAAGFVRAICIPLAPFIVMCTPHLFFQLMGIQTRAESLRI